MGVQGHSTQVVMPKVSFLISVSVKSLFLRQLRVFNQVTQHKYLFDTVKENNTEQSNKCEIYECNSFICKIKVETDKLLKNFKVSETISNLR